MPVEIPINPPLVKINRLTVSRAVKKLDAQLPSQYLNKQGFLSREAFSSVVEEHFLELEEIMHTLHDHNWELPNPYGLGLRSLITLLQRCFPGIQVPDNTGIATTWVFDRKVAEEPRLSPVDRQLILDNTVLWLKNQNNNPEKLELYYERLFSFARQFMEYLGWHFSALELSDMFFPVKSRKPQIALDFTFLHSLITKLRQKGLELTSFDNLNRELKACFAIAAVGNLSPDSTTALIKSIDSLRLFVYRFYSTNLPPETLLKQIDLALEESRGESEPKYLEMLSLLSEANLIAGD